MNLQCNGVVVIDEQKTRQCCFLSKEEILYSKPGDYILYHLINTTVKCKKGWAGDNCDACVPGWTGDDCDACAPGWLPPTCDQMCDGFGCCNQGECQGCIQNGRWEGTIASYNMEVHFTFRGERCSDLVPGKFM